MEPYDIAVPADCFAPAQNTFNCLIGQFADPATAAFTHDLLEEMLAERGRELLRRLLQAHLELRAEREHQTAIVSRCGPVIGKRQIEEAVVAAAADIDVFYRQRIPLPRTAEEVLVVVSVDGKGADGTAIGRCDPDPRPAVSGCAGRCPPTPTR
ncbi:esterase/lipase superfamily enzyme [Streptosporangium album]|uniref:Esterase/lipase superfamily enzyme n=1 Tax=Streptosporangium album TaxID=47479 RepID=A0A7W7WEL8_9ACTN|nr:hypothetical protein [Streptosporangium album]MBB4943605.1 esterase/lipase superfamily enzyme [Streptosporangium album]